jgi:hypothetical protein
MIMRRRMKIRRKGRKMNVRNKKFWEELITYFP